MSSNFTTKCKNCDQNLVACKCKQGEPVCGTCGKVLVACECDPDFLFHQCEACLEWKDCDQVGDAFQWVCRNCQEKPAVIWNLRNGGL